MKLDSSWFLLRILQMVIVCALMTRPASAAGVSIDELARQLTAEITKANVKSVAVADFLGTDGKPSDLGAYVADKLSDSMLAQTRVFQILDRAALQEARVSANELALNESLKRIGGAWGVETIVMGVVEISAEQYLVKASLRRVADGTEIATASQTLPHSRVLDLLSPAGVDPAAAKPARAGVLGVGVPLCAYCPAPIYSGRAPRVQSATVVLMVTVSIKGSADKISVMKSPGYELVEKAIETVSEWKFWPAPGKDGAPVRVDVPIEVGFRSSRT